MKMDMERLLKPLWQGDTVYRESFMPVRAPGEALQVPLLYQPEQVTELWNAEMTIRYEPGADYRVEGGRLLIPAQSPITGMTPEEYAPPDFIPGGCFWKRGGGYLRFSEGAFFHRYQYVVSYRHAERWQGPVPQGQLAWLPHVAGKLRQGQPVKVLFYGDSITTGANSSAVTGIEPYQPDWCQMVMAGLKARWPKTDFSSVNTAVGGTVSAWGLAEAEERAAKHRPDLAVIAFGMNDGSLGVTPEAYRDNIAGIMAAVRRAQPEAEFVLVATTVPNREALLTNDRPRCPGGDGPELEERGFYGTHDGLLPALRQLCGPGAALADMTGMHHALLARKAFRDMTGNNVNHPNDFLARVYAQTLLAVLED